MPYYRVLPPVLDKAQSTSTGERNAAQLSSSLREKAYLLPSLIACVAGLTLGIFFLI